MNHCQACRWPKLRRRLKTQGSQSWLALIQKLLRMAWTQGKSRSLVWMLKLSSEMPRKTRSQEPGWTGVTPQRKWKWPHILERK